MEEEIEESVKKFPGLFTEDPNYKNDSDCSSLGEKATKRELSKSKKERNRDIGYSALDSDSSPEDMDLFDSKNSSKVKKTKSFKFLQKWEKDDKDDKKKEKRKEKESRKREKEEKRRIKKDKKKKYHYNDEYFPIFGIPLAKAVERCPSHDGIRLPAIVRECIDFIEEKGLSCEGIYRTGGMKSKIQSLRRAYNFGEAVDFNDQQPHVVASLLKQYLRELPETVLTVDMMPHFEDVSLIPNPRERAETMRQLIDRLPTPNRLLLQYMLKHMGNVVEMEKENKMSYQNICVVLSPTMQISHRVLNVMFHSHQYLFGKVVIKRYIPPITSYSMDQRSIDEIRSPQLIEEELNKQESLLASLHAAVASGRITQSTEEQLWEAQRNHTLLKRRLKLCDRKEGDSASNEGSESSQEKVYIQAESQKELQLLNSKKVVASNESVIESVGQKSPPIGNNNTNQLSETEATDRSNGNEAAEVNPSQQNVSIHSAENGKPVLKDISINNISIKDSVPTTKDTKIPVLPKPVSVRMMRNKMVQEDKDATNDVNNSKKGNSLSSGYNKNSIEKTEYIEEKNNFSNDVQNTQMDHEDVDKRPESPTNIETFDFVEHHKRVNSLRGSRNKGSDYSILLREGLRLQFEHEELLCMNHELTRKLKAEKTEISRLKEEIQEMQTIYGYRTHSYDSSESERSDSDAESDTEDDILKQIASLDQMNDKVEHENALLMKKIEEEREAVIRLRVRLKEAKSQCNGELTQVPS